MEETLLDNILSPPGTKQAKKHRKREEERRSAAAASTGRRRPSLPNSVAYKVRQPKMQGRPVATSDDHSAPLQVACVRKGDAVKKQRAPDGAERQARAGIGPTPPAATRKVKNAKKQRHSDSIGGMREADADGNPAQVPEESTKSEPKPGLEQPVYGSTETKPEQRKRKIKAENQLGRAYKTQNKKKRGTVRRERDETEGDDDDGGNSIWRPNVQPPPAVLVGVIRPAALALPNPVVELRRQEAVQRLQRAVENTCRCVVWACLGCSRSALTRLGRGSGPWPKDLGLGFAKGGGGGMAPGGRRGRQWTIWGLPVHKLKFVCIPISLTPSLPALQEAACALCQQALRKLDPSEPSAGQGQHAYR